MLIRLPMGSTAFPMTSATAIHRAKPVTCGKVQPGHRITPACLHIRHAQPRPVVRSTTHTSLWRGVAWRGADRGPLPILAEQAGRRRPAAALVANSERVHCVVRVNCYHSYVIADELAPRHVRISRASFNKKIFFYPGGFVYFFVFIQYYVWFLKVYINVFVAGFSTSATIYDYSPRISFEELQQL